MKPDRNAVIAVVQTDEAEMRPATFVYTTPDGFAWVEPAYREAAPSRSCFHRVRGTMEMNTGGFTCEGEDGRYYSATALANVEPGIHEDLRDACEWAERDIEKSGATMDEEREHVRGQLGDELT